MFFKGNFWEKSYVFLLKINFFGVSRDGYVKIDRYRVNWEDFVCWKVRYVCCIYMVFWLVELVAGLGMGCFSYLFCVCIFVDFYVFC